MKSTLALLAALPALAFATVNVNTAQQSELQHVKGLDKIKAKQIIEYRAQNGGYGTVEDLAKVLDPATLDKVKPQLAVRGDAFVPPPGSKPDKPAKKTKKVASAD
jgi:competence protein ComEA